MPGCDSKTRYLPATFAWTLLLITTSLFFYYPCQFYISEYPWVPAVQGVIAFFVLANFTLATFMDPGVIPKAPPDEDRDEDHRAPLFKSVEINGITVRMKWCVTCKFYRPPRCSHCSVCDHCIETFDHHCPWVNNCIGRRNYRFFFFFLLSLSLHMLSIFGLCLYFVLHQKQRLGEVETTVAMVLMGVVTLLFIPILGLTGFHIVLVSRGRTTNEQVTGKFNGGYNPFSRGCFHNCCYTQFGPQYPSLMKPEKYLRKNRGACTSEISTIGSENQVKTYMDSSNGVRNASSNAYNKLSPGRDGSDTDMEPTASQSADCEPTPPLQRHGSKSNFFLPPVEPNDSPRHPQSQNRHPVHYSRSSPHPRPRGMNGSRSHTPDGLSPEGTVSPASGGLQRGQGGQGGGASPTMQQRIKAIGVPTPLAISSPIRRSNPGTPTQVRRPDYIGVNETPTYYDIQHHHHHHHHHNNNNNNNNMIHSGSNGGAGGGIVPGYSPQRRFLSESELIRANEHHYNASRTNNTSDNIRELAGSPQRGVYMWKDNSPIGYPGPQITGLPPIHPGIPVQRQQQQQQQPPPPPYDYYCSNPTSPMQQQQYNVTSQRGAYHPANRGGVAVFPPAHQSPQVKRKQSMITPTTPPPPPTGTATTPATTTTTTTTTTSSSSSSINDQTTNNAARRRPMSFVRALEMTDSMEMVSAPPSDNNNHHHHQIRSQTTQRPTTPTNNDRTSVYDMNYEISV